MEIYPLPGFSEPFSSWSHLFAAVLSFLGGYFLTLRGRGNGFRVFSLVVFTFSLVFLFSMSGVYHLLEPGGQPRLVFKHLDHAAIFVLIAGTFTPIHTILFRGTWRWGVLLAVWALAIAGLVLKVVFLTEIPEWLGLIFYLGLGWVGVLSGYKFRKQFDSEGFLWLWLGGVLYSIGAVMEFLRWPNPIYGVIGAHELFHIFVILGAFSHWVFVYRWSGYPLKDHMSFNVVVFPDGKHIARSVGDNVLLTSNSIEGLHLEIRRVVKLRYHHGVRPNIRLKYFKEETLSVD